MKSFFANYDSCINLLSKEPDSLELQHQAVLALAYAGSLDFALAEYRRYGLDEIKTLQDRALLEDIMGLGGRLLKDLYLSHLGKMAQEFALQSAEKYESAFQTTGGYYSGINSATMGLVAGMPEAIIEARAKNILRTLPSASDLPSETIYFIEATRAEAFLILGKIYKSRQLLRSAIDHDPRNYTAHASTLKQFKMILDYRQADKAWLTAFEPPRAAHFSGHLFKVGSEAVGGTITLEQHDQLKITLSDAIQSNDIGFGYGALAAGSDIIIAEVMLDEGCELHVTLPVALETFIESSVKPYGANWMSRFKACWDKAKTRSILTHETAWPDSDLDQFSNIVAMGKAVFQAKQFSVDAMQLLVWDKEYSNEGTARNASEWSQTKRAQVIIPYPGLRLQSVGNSKTNIGTTKVKLSVSGHKKAIEFDDIYSALNKSFDIQRESNHSARISVHVGIEELKKDESDLAFLLSDKAVPGSVLISEVGASLLVLNHSDEFIIEYIGRIEGKTDNTRAFAVKCKK